MDIDREWFSERTDIKPHWFDVRPVTWHHGDDPTMGNEPFGKSRDLELGDEGWWSQVWLDAGDRRLRYIEDIVKKLAAKGRELMGSSAPIGRFVKTDPSGEIRVWPHAEQTFSTSPQNTKSILQPGKAVADFDLAGIAIGPALRDVLIELDAIGMDLAETSTGLYVPESGDPSAKAGRVLSGKNESAIRDALVEFRQRVDDLETLIDGMVGTTDTDEGVPPSDG